MTNYAQITPQDIGLPPKFASWRPGQWESVETTVLSDRRFIAQCGPTGFGKTGYAVASAILTGGRAIYLTASKSLQDQLSNDGFSGLSDMRGRQNYSCVENHGVSCNEGRILGCRNSGCAYQCSRQAFLQSNLALTNYSYALSSAIHSEGTGPASLLICDEAHQLVQEVCSAIEVRLNHPRNNSLYNTFQSFPPYGKPISLWRTWAKFLLPKVQSHLKSVKESNNHKTLAQVDALAFAVERLANVPESWILDESNRDETLISPLWPTDYTHKYLFRDVPKVLLVSATIVPKTLQLLGVKEEESLFLSQDHTFDPSRCPVYLFGPCRVDYKMGEGQWQEVVGRMDMLIDQRQDRKGLIHSVSYAHQSTVLRLSRNRSIMIAPRHAGELKGAIEEFKRCSAPAILISPAITTGYDFPYCEAEFQIVIKVPFIDARSPVMKARKEADPDYLNYLTAQTLTQEIGRTMRAHDDRSETIILDAHANWFLKANRDLFPPWFMRQVRYANELPVPPPPLSLAT